MVTTQSSYGRIERDEVVRLLDELRAAAATAQRAGLMEEVAELLAHLDRVEPLTVVVAAEMSRGKSSLINALVGREALLPVDVDVSTGVFVLVADGKPARGKVYRFQEEQPLEIPLDSLDEWVAVDKNPHNHKRVDHVEVLLQAPLVRQGLVYCDTPGVGGLDTAHGTMTLAAIQRADGLIFVLDASAPLSAPELTFLQKAAERIERVTFALTKVDLHPRWREIRDENAALIREHAPRFADCPIHPISVPLAFDALQLRRDGDEEGARRLEERSGVAGLRHHLFATFVADQENVRLTNAVRYADSLAAALEDEVDARLRVLSGDAAPMDTLSERRLELEALQSEADGWPARLTLEFDQLERTLVAQLNDQLAGFKYRFGEEIDLRWRRERHLAFAAELQVDLQRIGTELDTNLQESLPSLLTAFARSLDIDDVAGSPASLRLPPREPVQARPEAVAEQLRAVRTRAFFNVFGAAAAAVMGVVTHGLSLFVASPLASVATQGHYLTEGRKTAEQREARSVLDQMEAGFRRDCTLAITDAVRGARGQAEIAVRHQIRRRREAIAEQISALAQQTKAAESERAVRRDLEERSQVIAAIRQHCAELLGFRAPDGAAAR